MFMAVAVETFKHPLKRNQYKIWYLELNDGKQVVGIGVKTKEELLENLFAYYQQVGKSNWRAFLKGNDKSTPVEVFDFIAQNTMENTHFGNLPTLAEFQETLNHLEMNLEFRAIA